MDIEHFVSPQQLKRLVVDESPVVVDCRFRLTDPEWGRRVFCEGHIPGACYAHLDLDLADLGRDGGRHPLPDVEDFQNTLAEWGWRPGRALIAYDDASGAIAARLWWMMRHLGEKNVALLDGGWPAWVASNGALESGKQHSHHREVLPKGLQWGHMPVVEENDLLDALHRELLTLVDARAAPRFRGESEPIDAVAGHIPGALNRPFDENLSVDGCIRDPVDLARDWGDLVGEYEGKIAHMCGSGVTACLNILASEYAGRPAGSLYVNSWSGWIQDSTRPVVKGAKQ